MPGESEQIITLQNLRKKIEDVFLPSLQGFAKESSELVKLRLESSEERARLEIVFNNYLGKGLFREIADDITKTIQQLENVKKNPRAQSVWEQELKEGKENFFLPENFLSLGPAQSLIKYLTLSSASITEQIETLAQDLKSKQKRETDENDENAFEKILESRAKQTVSDEKVKSTEKKTEEIRKEKRALMQRAKDAYTTYKARFPQEINKTLSPLRQFEKKHINDFFEAAEIGVIFPATSDEDIYRILGQYGLLERIGNNPQALKVARDIFRSIRSARRQEMEVNGQSTSILTSSDPTADNIVQNSIITLAQRVGPGPIVTSLTTKPNELQRIAQENPESESAQLHDRITQEFLVNLATPKKSDPSILDLFSQTFKEATGQETLEVNPDVAITDSLSETLEAGGQSSSLHSKKQRRNRLLKLADTANNITSNSLGLPVKLGAGVAGIGIGTTISAILAQAPGAIAMGGAITGAGSGMAIGAAIGSIIPGIGTIAGGLFGGIVGGVGGGIAGYAGGSLAFGKGAQTSLSSLSGQTLTNAATATQPLITQGANQIGIASANSLTGMSNFLHSLSGLQPLFSSTFASLGLIVGPLAITAIITVTIVFPALLAPYIPPPRVSPDSASVCSVGSWPTSGTISAAKTYGSDQPHGIWVGGALPGGIRLSLEGKSLQAPGSNWAAIDISGNDGKDVFSPYDGVGFAQADRGTLPFADKDSCTSNGGFFLRNSCWITPYGNSVWVKVNDPEKGSFVLVFAHLSGFATSLPVGTEFPVNANQFLGKVGKSGNSTGPHLHYEVIGLDKVIDIAADHIIPKAVDIGEQVSRDSCSNPGEDTDAETLANACLNSSGGTASFVYNPDPPLVDPVPPDPNTYKMSGCGRLGRAANKYVSQLDRGWCGLYNQPTDKSVRSSLWKKDSEFKSQKGLYNFAPQDAAQRGYTDMAWCTSVINVVYKANVDPDWPTIGGVPVMRQQWQGMTGQPLRSAQSTELKDVPIGSAVFYGNAHVGMVCSKAADGSSITSCEANTGGIFNTIQATSTGTADPASGVTDFGFAPVDPGCEEVVETKKPNGAECFSRNDCLSNYCNIKGIPGPNNRTMVCQDDPNNPEPPTNGPF